MFRLKRRQKRALKQMQKQLIREIRVICDLRLTYKQALRGLFVTGTSVIHCSFQRRWTSAEADTGASPVPQGHNYAEASARKRKGRMMNQD